MKDRLLLDKNILLDVILGRERQEKIKSLIVEFEEIFITTHTFATCFYTLRKSQITKEEIYQDLNNFELLEIDKIDCHLAFNIAKNLDDIEDCLELCTAKRNKAKTITADQKLVYNYQDLFDLVLV